MLRRRARMAGAIALIGVLGLLGCAPEPPAQAPAPSAPPPSSTPTPAPSLSPDERAADIVSAWTVRERVASITMGTTSGVNAESLTGFLSRTGAGGIILMGDNIPATAQELSDLTAKIGGDPELPTLIAIDQEGGEVTRIPWDHHASAITLKHEDVAATEEAFAARAELLQAAEITINFGIVADYTTDSTSFIYNRALGTSADSTSARVTAAVTAESGKVLSTLKHFPGHGAAAGDSHLAIPRTTMTHEEWSDSVAVPFRSGIAAGADLLMYGHLEYADVDERPASLSPEWHRIAREELGFTGVTVTDDLGMLLSSGVPQYADPVQNGVDALAAGNDLLLWIAGSDEATLIAMIDGISAAVEQGSVPESRLDEAATRVTALRLMLAEGSAP